MKTHERNGGSGRGLFLAGLLIACLIFAFAAAICIQIFAGSHTMSRRSTELSHAMNAASSAAEVLKATCGDINETARILGAVTAESRYLSVYYDDNWCAVPAETQGSSVCAFVMQLELLEINENFTLAAIKIKSAPDGEIGDEIFAMEVAA